MSKTLVAYFSATGETGRLAGTLARVAQADLYQIRPVQPYTAADLNWHDPASRSSVEMKDPACRPTIVDDMPDLSRYEAVFVGFPIWWYQAPRIIETFLESADFSGKTVIPFATSGGSGLGHTREILQKACSSRARWLPGRRLNSSESPASLRIWLNELNLRP